MLAYGVHAAIVMSCILVPLCVYERFSGTLLKRCCSLLACAHALAFMCDPHFRFAIGVGGCTHPCSMVSCLYSFMGWIARNITLLRFSLAGGKLDRAHCHLITIMPHALVWNCYFFALHGTWKCVVKCIQRPQSVFTFSATLVCFSLWIALRQDSTLYIWHHSITPGTHSTQYARFCKLRRRKSTTDFACQLFYIITDRI